MDAQVVWRSSQAPIKLKAGEDGDDWDSPVIRRPSQVPIESEAEDDNDDLDAPVVRRKSSLHAPPSPTEMPSPSAPIPPPPIVLEDDDFFLARPKIGPSRFRGKAMAARELENKEVR